MKKISSNSILIDAEHQVLLVSYIISELGNLSRSGSLTPDQLEAIGIALLCFADKFLNGNESLINWFLGPTPKENAAILKDCFAKTLQTFYSNAKLFDSGPKITGWKQ